AEQLKDKQEASIEVKKALEKLLESQKASKQAEQQLDSIREAIQELENEKKIFEERDQKVQKILAIEKELQKATKQIKDLEKNDGVYIEKIELLSANLEQLVNWREALEESRSALEEVKKTFDKNLQKKTILEKLNALQETLTKQLEEDKKISTKLHKSQKRYDEARQYYFGNIAGVLAAELNEAEHCLVCGSIHQTNLAQMNADAITKEKLTKYEETKNKDHMAHTKLTAEITQTGQLMDEHKNLLENFEDEELNDLKTVFEKEKKLKIEITQFEEKIEELQNYINQEDQWRKDLDNTQRAKQANQLTLQQENNNQRRALEKIKELYEEIQALEEAHVHTSTMEIEAEVDEQRKFIQTIQMEAERIQKALNQKENEQTQIVTSIAMLKEQ